MYYTMGWHNMVWYTAGHTVLYTILSCATQRTGWTMDGIWYTMAWDMWSCSIASTDYPHNTWQDRSIHWPRHFGTFWDCFGHLVAILDMFIRNGISVISYFASCCRKTGEERYSGRDLKFTEVSQILKTPVYKTTYCNVTSTPGSVWHCFCNSLSIVYIYLTLSVIPIILPLN